MRKKILLLGGMAVLSFSVMCGFTFKSSGNVTKKGDYKISVSNGNESLASTDKNFAKQKEELEDEPKEIEQVFFTGDEISAESLAVAQESEDMDEEPFMDQDEEDSDESLITDDQEESSITVLFEDGSETKTYDTAGTYSEKIVITDASGNSETETITFQVIDDMEKPVFKGLKNRTVYIGSTIDYLINVTAEDNKDGDVTDQIVVDSSKVNLEKAGTYKVTYTVSDSSGNKAVKTKKVTVKKDAAPILTGVKNRTVYVNGTINYLKGVKAKDKRDGNLTDQIVVDSSNVNLAAAGSYQITYSVTDSSNNTTVKTAVIKVKESK